MDELRPEDFAEAALAAMAALPGDPAGHAAHLAGAGLTGVLTPEPLGGLGLPLDFVLPVASAAGRSLLPFPLVETLLVAEALADVAPDLATALAVGEATASIQWAGGAALSDGCTHTLLGSGTLIALDGATEMPQGALDLGLRVVRIEGGTPVALLSAPAMERLTTRAHILYAALILGSAEMALETAVDYTTTRVQFGRPLIALQALRHNLSRQKLALEGIRHALHHALTEATEAAATTAFLVATQNGAAVVEGAVQLHGGMGFTWDVPLHRHLRRIRRIQSQRGAPVLAARLAAGFIASVA